MPASTVVNVSTSTPAVVRVGAVPPAQSTLPGQLTVCDPPLVKIRVNDPHLPVAGGFENVKVERFRQLPLSILRDVPTIIVLNVQLFEASKFWDHLDHLLHLLVVP